MFFWGLNLWDLDLSVCVRACVCVTDILVEYVGETVVVINCVASAQPVP